MRNMKFKRFTSMLLLCAMLATRLFGGKVELVSAAEELEEYIITTDNEDTLNRVKKQYKENIVDDYKMYDVDDKSSLYVGLTKSQCKSVERLDGVVDVEENVVFSACKSHEKHTVKKRKAKKSNALDWNLRMIGATGREKQNKLNDKPIKVAIMDSGVDVSEDVNVVKRVNLVDNEKNIAPNYEDITSHGTSIAGIVSDINPDAELYSVRVLDSNNTAKLNRVIEGIYWCIDNDIDIINMSFGTKYNSVALEKAVNAAYNAGILMISAAGNSGNDENVEYPAAYDNVIAVGGVDKNATLTEESTTGEEIELVAPGSQVLTDGAFGGSLVAGGTSLSVAHVTGVASAIWEKDLSKSNRFVRNLLSASARNLGKSNLYGNGLVDMKYALRHYDEYADYYESTVCETEKIEKVNYPINNTDVKTFDDVQMIEGRWDSNGHKNIVDFANPVGHNSFTSDEMLIIKDACAKVDGIIDHGINEQNSTYHFRTSTQNVLHGKYNYISTMNYLYRVSREIYNSDSGTSVSSCCDKYSYSPHSDNAGYDKSIPTNLKKAIQYMAAADTPIADTSTISWQKRRGLRILGMMLHVVGDTYAHKTKVPLKCISDGTITNANIVVSGMTWEGFQYEVRKGMMFNQVKKYLGSGYEDNVNFYLNRYQAAKEVSKNVVQYFLADKYEIEPDKFMKSARVYDGQGVLCEETKLAYLSKHVRWEYNDKTRAVVAGTVSFNPYSGEYTSFK